MNVCICKCCIIHCELARRNCWLCLIYLALNLFFFKHGSVFEVQNQNPKWSAEGRHYSNRQQ